MRFVVVAMFPRDDQLESYITSRLLSAVADFLLLSWPGRVKENRINLRVVIAGVFSYTYRLEKKGPVSGGVLRSDAARQGIQSLGLQPAPAPSQCVRRLRVLLYLNALVFQAVE